MNNSEQLLHLSEKVIGETATHAIVKQSLFAHFCAGENEQDIQPVLRKLEAAGVGTFGETTTLSSETQIHHWFVR